MAKEIKAIECPKCGSTDKTEIRTDVFRCDSCGTEYYLDNDDININYTYRNQPVTPSPIVTPQAAKARVIVFAVIAILAIGIYAASHIFSGTAGSSSFTSAVTPGFSWGYSKSTLFQSAEGRPVLLIIGNRSYNGVGKDGIYLSFIDAQNGKELKSSFLGAGATGSASTDYTVITFSNGDIYVVVNKTTVYKADKTSYTAGNVTNTLFAGHSELSSGIANIQPVSDGDGDGFNLFTNDGKNMYYFPLINRVYNKDDFYHAQVTFKNALPGSKQKTAFTFSSKSFAYPDEKIQLLTYQYLDNGGGPKDEPLFRWDDDYGGSGVFTDADPHRKVLLYASQKEEARIISFKDFTPERLYFDPELLYYDADYILITFRPTAAENAATSLQCLNAHTAAIVFTIRLSSDVSNINDGVRYHDGFAISTSQGTYTTDMNGKLTQGYKMN